VVVRAQQVRVPACAASVRMFGDPAPWDLNDQSVRRNARPGGAGSETTDAIPCCPQEQTPDVARRNFLSRCDVIYTVMLHFVRPVWSLALALAMLTLGQQLICDSILTAWAPSSRIYPRHGLNRIIPQTSTIPAMQQPGLPHRHHTTPYCSGVQSVLCGL
jgi:hypothetical protein